MMRKKCGKSRNPCKICFQTVTKRNGLQCEGACKIWAHYKCLGFTPGKILDIKAGTLKVLCPCPDCCVEPKELLINPPFTCKNNQCPANSFPKCDSSECPINKGPPCQPPPPSSNKAKAKFPISPAPYEKSKQEFSVQYPSKLYCPPMNTSPKQKVGKEMATQQSKSCSCISSATNSDCRQSCKKPSLAFGKQQFIKPSSSDCEINEKRRDCSSTMISALEQVCRTVTTLSDQIKKVMTKLTEKSH